MDLQTVWTEGCLLTVDCWYILLHCNEPLSYSRKVGPTSQSKSHCFTSNTSRFGYPEMLWKSTESTGSRHPTASDGQTFDDTQHTTIRPMTQCSHSHQVHRTLSVSWNFQLRMSPIRYSKVIQFLFCIFRSLIAWSQQCVDSTRSSSAF